MRILILATDVFTRGGVARYTSTLASALGRVIGRDNVDVLSFFSWGESETKPSEFRLLGTISGRPRADAVSQLRFLLKAAGASRNHYDLVIANHVALAPVAAMIKFAFGVPYWVVCHSIEVWWGISRTRHVALKNARLVLPVSNYTAEVLRKLKGIRHDRVKVLYNAIPDSFSEQLQVVETSKFASLQTSAPNLLSVCCLVAGNEFKGVDTTIRALPRMLRTFPDLHYTVVGAGAIRPQLEVFAAETGVAENVTFLGEVSDTELALLYCSCDVFVLPSRAQEGKGRIGGEGFGRVYVEAALAGKPVVGSRSGGASEAVIPGKTGLLVDPDSTVEVADAVLALLNDRPLALRMGLEAKRWAGAKFSEKALCASLAELLLPYGLSADACVEQIEPQLEAAFPSMADSAIYLASAKGKP